MASPREAPPEAVPTAQQEVARLAGLSELRAASAWFRSQETQVACWQLEMARIPAPPFGEAARAEWLKKRFREVGLADVHIDSVGNVFGIRDGSGPGFVSLSAHIDTVFPAGTPLNVRQQGTRLYGPGVSDNGAGVAALLAVAAALQAAKIAPQTPIVFVGNVGEEGEGDLRGMRHIFANPRWKDSIRYSLVLDGAGADTIVAEALGSRRFEVIVRGPGGHSWSDFGAPNPILVLARAIRAFAQSPVPTSPKTTFNIGVIRGGTSVNSIPESASMRVDIRSTSMAEMERLEAALRRELELASEEETLASERRNPSPKRSTALSYEIVAIGNRPAGELASDARMLKVIRAVDAHLGNAAQIQRASTDANIPLSLSREAIAIGGGGTGGGAHTLQEWFDCSGRELSLKRILLTVLALAGIRE
ncbi:Peptidase M20 [Candidatus Sulfotelmatobacter sp. SbA7]|jgi:tripeptide aminopeptidase|nr:Peptidase M20 [Candidatus Sulfotelmatobacter sp. SbA7]